MTNVPLHKGFLLFRKCSLYSFLIPRNSLYLLFPNFNEFMKTKSLTIKMPIYLK